MSNVTTKLVVQFSVFRAMVCGVHIILILVDLWGEGYFAERDALVKMLGQHLPYYRRWNWDPEAGSWDSTVLPGTTVPFHPPSSHSLRWQFR